LSTTFLLGSADATKKRKKPRPRLNAFGCVDVGQPCRGNDALCCSGLCGGKKPKHGQKDKRRCIAHNGGACHAEQDSCSPRLFPCGVNGNCVRTTGQASFCGKGGVCEVCTKDEDCVALAYGPGAACIICANCDAGTSCFEAAA
jgi:hypothetical protein